MQFTLRRTAACVSALTDWHDAASTRECVRQNAQARLGACGEPTFGTPAPQRAPRRARLTADGGVQTQPTSDAPPSECVNLRLPQIASDRSRSPCMHIACSINTQAANGTLIIITLTVLSASTGVGGTPCTLSNSLSAPGLATARHPSQRAEGTTSVAPAPQEAASTEGGGRLTAHTPPLCRLARGNVRRPEQPATSIVAWAGAAASDGNGAASAKLHTSAPSRESSLHAKRVERHAAAPAPQNAPHIPAAHAYVPPAHSPSVFLRFSFLVRFALAARSPLRLSSKIRVCGWSAPRMALAVPMASKR